MYALILASENAELRLQLAEAQDQCVELAVDAGEFHAEVEALCAQLAEVSEQRDAWLAEAERLRGRAVARGWDTARALHIQHQHARSDGPSLDGRYGAAGETLRAKP